jgi:dGTPase
MTDHRYFTFTDEEQALLDAHNTRTTAVLSPFATRDEAALRKHEHTGADASNLLLRGPYSVDIDKILHNPFFNRCADKTQVFSLYRNDDLTHRSLHLQLVARTARIISSALDLNTELTEAIALGHDMGHTPFGHRGEAILDHISRAHTARSFHHNVHSVRTLKSVLWCNLTLQTYDGILCHCGEKDFETYEPGTLASFETLEAELEKCYTLEGYVDSLKPSTLEGCVVRISDILAYIGKDRQDAEKAGLATKRYESKLLGSTNASILDRTIKNLVKNSLGQPCLRMDAEVAGELARLRAENYALIYDDHNVNGAGRILEELMEQVFTRLVDDYRAGREESPLFVHHLGSYDIARHYLTEDPAPTPETIVIDYLASMTDGYLIDLYGFLFPHSTLTDQLIYHSYFEGLAG